jgi:hydroxymethylglutaryl-CoA lyase
MLRGLGIETGIDLDKLIDAAAYISGVIGSKPVSRTGSAMLAKRAAGASSPTRPVVAR